MTKEIINFNGELMDPKDAKISIFDRGFLYGDSIYEVTLTYEKVPFLLDEHLDRLWRSAERIYMPLRFSREELIKEVKKGINHLNLDRLYIRIIVTRGEGEIGLDPNLATAQNLIIMFRELPEYPKKWYEEGVQMIVADVLRNPKEAMDPDVKSGNYLNNVLAMTQAKQKGAYDAIMLNDKGNVTEGTTSNIWIVKGDKVITPSLKAGILGGITRATLIEVARGAGIEVVEADFSPEILKSSDEVFLTSSTREIVPITSIDENVIGSGKPGKMTQRLHSLYRNFVGAEIRAYKK